SIIDLLDAQNASLRAEESAANAVYDFLIEVMNVERATGQYDFLASPEEQRALARAIRTHLASLEASR
ncbi:MAG: hypothetical protein R3200_05865, partial [Xanthomonadales bacterium]|nr:hypothetical protein [Xanthomonadales bacterium]